MFAEIDETKLIAAMAIGALFALAGLALMFRRGPAEGEHAAEFLGLKFRVTSTGLAVFLVGAFFFAAPLFLGVSRSPTSAPSPSPAAPQSALREAATGLAPMQSSGRAQSLAIRDREEEPNDGIRAANLIEFGKTYRGTISFGNSDYFAFQNTSDETYYRVILRVSNAMDSIFIYLLNRNEEGSSLGFATDLMQFSKAVRIVGQGTFYVRLTNSMHTTIPSYELEIRPET
jgi:hypothetical protein